MSNATQEEWLDNILKEHSCSSIEELKVLHLSNHNLTSIDGEILSGFTNLEELHISHNTLTEFPSLSNCKALKLIDCSNNSLVSIDSFSSVSNLSSLKVHGNSSITVSDRYKLIASLPSLTLLDDKEVDTMRDAISRLDKLLKDKLNDLYESEDLSLGDDNPTVDEVVAKVFALAKEKIKCGPEVLQDYRLFQLETAIEQKMKAENESGNLYNFISKSIIKSVIDNVAPPTKKIKSDENQNIKTHLGMKDCEAVASEIYSLDQDKKTHKLSYLLQTHSINNDPKDLETKVWMCEFEPDPFNPGSTTSVCATCGGDSVCFIDCKTGLVLKKYKQPKEVFYCLAWTLLDTPSDYGSNCGKASVLAVAGLHGDIKLIDPQQLICYQEVSHHRKPIDALLFHPDRPSWLFSGSEDRTIVLWDVGIPFKSTMETKALRLLTLKAGSIVRQIAIIPHGKVLVGSCDDGCYVWSIDDVNQHQNRTALYKFIFPGDKRLPVDSVSCVSNHVVATKRIEEGSIQLWYSDSCYVKNDFVITHTLPWRLTDTPFLKFNFSSANRLLMAGDDAGYVWLFDLRAASEAQPKAKSREEHGQTIELSHLRKLFCSNKHAKLFNHVSCSSSAKYIVAVADTNVVAIWKAILK